MKKIWKNGSWGRDTDGREIFLSIVGYQCFVVSGDDFLVNATGELRWIQKQETQSVLCQKLRCFYTHYARDTFWTLAFTWTYIHSFLEHSISYHTMETETMHRIQIKYPLFSSRRKTKTLKTYMPIHWKINTSRDEYLSSRPFHSLFPSTINTPSNCPTDMCIIHSFTSIS